MHEVEDGGVETKHVVEVKHADAKIEEDGKLHIPVKVVIDGVEVERTWTFLRNRGATHGYVNTLVDVPGGREADVKRLKTLSEPIFGDAGSLTGNGSRLQYTRRHLEHATRFAELKDEIERLLHQNSPRGPVV